MSQTGFVKLTTRWRRGERGAVDKNNQTFGEKSRGFLENGEKGKSLSLQFFPRGVSDLAALPLARRRCTFAFCPALRHKLASELDLPLSFAVGWRRRRRHRWRERKGAGLVSLAEEEEETNGKGGSKGTRERVRSRGRLPSQGRRPLAKSEVATSSPHLPKTYGNTKHRFRKRW